MRRLPLFAAASIVCAASEATIPPDMTAEGKPSGTAQILVELAASPQPDLLAKFAAGHGWFAEGMRRSPQNRSRELSRAWLQEIGWGDCRIFRKARSSVPKERAVAAWSEIELRGELGLIDNR